MIGAMTTPADAERRLADEDGQQDLPRLRVGLAAHDARVDQVLELVDEHQEDERRDGRADRDAEGENHDHGVGDQVAEDRDQSADEGDDDDGRGEREVLAEERQHDQQVDGGERGVDRGDLDLRDGDPREGLARNGPLSRSRCRPAGRGRCSCFVTWRKKTSTASSMPMIMCTRPC